MDIGIRALRDSLSHQLAAVRAGHTITVTDHGHPIARLVPVDAADPIERLRAAGRLRPPEDERGELPPAVKASGSVSDLVAEQRR
jgi:prevent-host-death family protein